MTYDSARGVTVLFGGHNSSRFGDTWEWDGTAWTLRSNSGPSARYGHAMAYDRDRGATILFGGYGDSRLGDTWEWDGSTWTLRSDTGPSPRFYHAMSYDSARGVAVLFGGFEGFVVDDTWEWDGSTWTLRSDTGPPRRNRHSMAYDSARGVTVLFGGDQGGPYLGDTWEWEGTTWTPRSNSGPGPRSAHAMVYDSSREVTILFGGYSNNSLGDTLEWDGSTWTFRSNSGPSRRRSHAMAYDRARGVTVLFGGDDGGRRGDTWERDDGSCLTGGDDVCVSGTGDGQPCTQHVECPAGRCQLKNRFITASIPATATSHGLRVHLTSLDANSVSTPGSYDGTDRWAGVPLLGINDGILPNFNASRVQCAFMAQDWSAVGQVHFYGDVVVPQSLYDVSVCSSASGPCSAALRIDTAKFGDVVIPVNTVDFQDVNSIVAKFQGTPAGPSKTRTKLTNSIVNPANPINFQEVSACVSAFQSKAFKTVVTAPPAICP